MLLKQDNCLYIKKSTLESHDKLPPGNYILKENPHGLFLAEIPPFTIPKKLYGNFDYIDRWLHTFDSMPDKNLGILMAGIKGSGKTVAIKKLCIESKRPVIAITEHYDQIGEFLANPEVQNSIILLDEFDKVYQEYDDQATLLSIMDGLFASHLIFAIIVNETRINSYLMNRLSRIRYKKMWTYLPKDLIRHIVGDMLKNKDHENSLLEFCEDCYNLSIDNLVCVIQDMNTFNEDAYTVAKYLNLMEEDAFCDIYIIIEDEKYCISTGTLVSLSNPEYCKTISTFNQRHTKEFNKIAAKLPDYCQIDFESSLPKRIKRGVYIYEDDSKNKYELVRTEPRKEL